VFANHVLVIHYVTPQHYIWLVFYDLSLITIGWKVPCQTFNDFLSFDICLLQLKAFSHLMFDMTTKSIICEVINLRISSSESMHKGCIKENFDANILIKVL
jgi:hypothetical protein